MQSPDLSIVIPTYNRADFLNDCLRSFVNQEFPKSYEVLVCDDGSTDQTAEVIRTIQSECKPGCSIQYLLGSHGGSNSARNMGIRNAKSKLILFFDDDQLAPSDFLQKLLDAFEKHPEADGIGGPVRDAGGSKLRTCSECSLASVSLPDPSEHFSQRLLSGNMTLKSDLFKTFGLFDEELRGRGEENEWFQRAESRKFLYMPDLWAWHRRDHFTVWMLCSHAFRHGLAIPLSRKKMKDRYELRPDRVFRYLGHAVIRRCAKGIVLASREVGATVGYLRLKFQHQ